MAIPQLNIHELSVDDRLKLVEELWESLAQDPPSIPLTSAQKGELDRRLDAAEQDGGAGLPWDEVEARIRARRP